MGKKRKKEEEVGLERIYPGVHKYQKEFLRKEAKLLGKKDGQTVRHIIDFYITNKDKIKHD